MRSDSHSTDFSLPVFASGAGVNCRNSGAGVRCRREVSQAAKAECDRDESQCSTKTCSAKTPDLAGSLQMSFADPPYEFPSGLQVAALQALAQDLGTIQSHIPRHRARLVSFGGEVLRATWQARTRSRAGRLRLGLLSQAFMPRRSSSSASATAIFLASPSEIISSHPRRALPLR